jgi:PAS domain S-box-containing protein
MGIPIRVLIVEDTDDDKELVLRHLKLGGYNPEYICVETREGLLSALDNQTWDIILCDYSMPKFDGLSALKIVKEKVMDIPFILLSGTVGEDVAVEAMKAGAQDYMMKDNLIRLIPVVKRELAEAKIRKEKKMADEEIGNKSAVLDAIINNSHSILIFMLDTKYRYLEFNENYRKSIKEVYSVDIEYGISMLDLISIPEEKKKRKESIDKVLLGGSFIEIELQAKLNIYYEFHWNAVRKDDAIIGVSCFIIDITKRKQSEIALKESTQFNVEIINSAQEGIIVYDLDQKYQVWNPYMEHITGMLASEVLGKRPSDLFPFLKDAGMIDQIKKALLGETGIAIDFPFEIPSSGKIGWVTDTVAPMRNSIGEVIGAISTVQNITERKKTEQKLISALEKATESDLLKSAFLANMSHEIRTPMNGILGFADLLKESKLKPDKHKEYVNIIEKSGVRMLNILDEIIDISKIESGTMNITISATDIINQLNYILSLFKPETKKKNLDFELKISMSEKEAVVEIDSEKIYAILTNLVKNAIKYTDIGKIEFGCDIKGDFLEFFIKDTGIGIPKDRQKSIFERFIQADIADVQARQGAGLGLSISKAYVEMLGGKIWVESEEKKGSNFYFTIPYNVSPIDNSKTNQIVDLTDDDYKLKILIAEDDQASRKFISIIIDKFSQEIITTETGIDAVEIAKAKPDIDLILMDIQMPCMNGFEAVRNIRLFNQEVIIIAQTAFGLSGDREKALLVGCNDYVSKPIKKEELFALIRKYFSNKCNSNIQEEIK